MRFTDRRVVCSIRLLFSMDLMAFMNDLENKGVVCLRSESRSFSLLESGMAELEFRD
jgi:hypothetical protein